MEQSGTTIMAEFFSKEMIINQKEVKVQIWDTAGQELFKSISNTFYKQSDGVLLVYDITSTESFENLEYWNKQIKNNTKDINILVIGNKMDLDSERQISKEQGEDYAKNMNYLFQETSALNNDGKEIQKGLQTLIENILNRQIQQSNQDDGVVTKNISLISQSSSQKSNIIITADCCSQLKQNIIKYKLVYNKMVQLNEVKLKEAKHVFSLYESKDQRLSFEDLAQAIRALGVSITDAEVEDFIRDMKVVGNQNVDLPEFISLISDKFADLDLKSELEECFSLFDRKKNGRVAVKELRFVFSNICDRLNKRDIDMLLNEENLRNKPELDFKEFCKLMTQLIIIINEQK